MDFKSHFSTEIVSQKQNSNLVLFMCDHSALPASFAGYRSRKLGEKIGSSGRVGFNKEVVGTTVIKNHGFSSNLIPDLKPSALYTAIESKIFGKDKNSPHFSSS